MCGLAGFWEPGGTGSREELESRAEAMARTLAHRGPDDQGVWADQEAGLALGHRRLSIIDLSPLGRQPMISPGGRYVVSFNGEIYNYRELRLLLEERGASFAGNSDTEVLLSCVEEWGLEPALDRLRGMFALALWDRRERTLHLVRDRLGIKPLYYGLHQGALLFGSELKALQAHPSWQGQVDRGALTLFLKNGYVPAPWSIYQGIYKLPAGSVLSLDERSLSSSLPRPRPFWSLHRVMEQGRGEPFRGGLGRAARELRRLLDLAVRDRLVADVEVGAFLSGGLDSTLVTALMQARSGVRIKTFTIGFEEETHNEAVWAARVADHLGTDHTELYLNSGQAREVIPDLPGVYDEPFADPSQIPTLILSRLTAGRVKVALSGDGGDELFGGYDRYQAALGVWSRLRFCPRPLRGLAARSLRTLPAGLWRRVLALAGLLRTGALGGRSLEYTLQKGARVVEEGDPARFYVGLLAHWKDPAQVVVEGRESLSVMNDPAELHRFRDLLTMMRYLDLAAYHPDNILVKVDRASMSAGLEVRVPLIDHRVVEFAAGLPNSMLVRGGRTKIVLREVLRELVPDPLIERPKMGFGVPLGRWLRGPLREWARDLLAPERLAREGFLRPEPIIRKWEEHQSGRADWKYLLWNVLVFQAWLERG